MPLARLVLPEGTHQTGPESAFYSIAARCGVSREALGNWRQASGVDPQITGVRVRLTMFVPKETPPRKRRIDYLARRGVPIALTARGPAGKSENSELEARHVASL